MVSQIINIKLAHSENFQLWTEIGLNRKTYWQREKGMYQHFLIFEVISSILQNFSAVSPLNILRFQCLRVFLIYSVTFISTLLNSLVLGVTLNNYIYLKKVCHYWTINKYRPHNITCYVDLIQVWNGKHYISF